MQKLENKIAVVTGGNSGIGLATVRLFASEGASEGFFAAQGNPYESRDYRSRPSYA